MAPIAVTDAPAGDALEQRVLAATGRCVARWGIAKTTLDDVAREAGCSRATVYRAVPGGKDALVAAYVRGEIGRCLAALSRRLDAATDLEDLLTGGLSEAARFLAGHAPLQYLLANEPEVVLPAVAFSRMDRVFAVAAAFAAPWLRPWLGDRAGEAAEWLCRLACSYLLSPAPGMDLTDEDDARRLVRDFVIPGLHPTPSLDLTDDRS